MDTKRKDPSPIARSLPEGLPEIRLGRAAQDGTAQLATAAVAGSNGPVCRVQQVDTDRTAAPAAKAEPFASEQVSLITAALETMRLAPNADTFVREALGTIVARLGGCGGALWTVGSGLHDTRIATDYEREFECFRNRRIANSCPSASSIRRAQRSGRTISRTS